VLELCNDEEIFIRIEAFEAITYVLECIEVETIEKEVIIPLLKMLQSDHDEVIERVSSFLGPLSWKLSLREGLHLRHKDELIEFYNRNCAHKSDIIRQNAAYNLPCMNLLFHKFLQ